VRTKGQLPGFRIGEAGVRLACLLDLAERGRRQKQRPTRQCHGGGGGTVQEGSGERVCCFARLVAGLVPSWELDVGHWALRLDGTGCEREEWAECRSGESVSIFFRYYSLPSKKKGSKAVTKERRRFGHGQPVNRCSTLLCYLLTPNCRNGRHFRSSVRIIQLCKMGVPGGRPN
jgi:hypothetical protein